ncbi:conserved protein of unknown function [Tenacibaculum sp. 190524A02b]|uniref:Uncharacterized protein n=1 Tax=Tenacibaculum vairaonense TaxID=3137860 RepID=A0ABM9PLT0_9FLAO
MKDTLICYGAGIGIPKLIFEVKIAISDYDGAAAITSCLKDVSMRIGMEEGIGVFVGIGIITYQLTSYLISHYYKDKIERDRLELKLKDIDAVQAQIDTYLISKPLRKKLKSNYLVPN